MLFRSGPAAQALSFEVSSGRLSALTGMITCSHALLNEEQAPLVGCASGQTLQSFVCLYPGMLLALSDLLPASGCSCFGPLPIFVELSRLCLPLVLQKRTGAAVCAIHSPLSQQAGSLPWLQCAYLNCRLQWHQRWLGLSSHHLLIPVGGNLHVAMLKHGIDACWHPTSLLSCLS